MLTRQEAGVCNSTTSMLLTFKPKSLKEVLLNYFSFLFRCQNNIREFGKHGGFSFRSLEIQRAVDTNTRLMWRNHLLLISSSAGQRGPREEATGSAANHVPESCQILVVAIGPHQSGTASLWGFFWLQSHQGFPPAAAICARPKNGYRIQPLKENNR